MEIKNIYLNYSGSDFEENLAEKWKDLAEGKKLKR